MPTPHHLLLQPHAQTRPGGFPRRHPPSYIRARGSIPTGNMNRDGRRLLHIFCQCIPRNGFLRRGWMVCPAPRSHSRPTRNIGRGRPGAQLVKHVHRVAGRQGRLRVSGGRHGHRPLVHPLGYTRRRIQSTRENAGIRISGRIWPRGRWRNWRQVAACQLVQGYRPRQWKARWM